MTPPPSSNQPLFQRLLALARTLQFAWFAGHLTLLFAAVRYGLSYVTVNWSSAMARVMYRTSFLSAAVTYGIVVYKGYRARTRAGQKPQTPIQMLSDENVQYLAMALIWLFSRQIPVAIASFAIYSVFHVATYTRSNLVPLIQPPPQGSAAPGASPSSKPPQSGIAETLGRFVKEYYEPSMKIVAGVEIVTWFRLLLSFLTFSRGAIFLFLAYTAFLRARYAQSPHVQNTIHQLTARIDATVANQGTPPVVRQAWGTIKDVMRQAAEATDLSRYLGQAGTGPKKAQ
ncbi:MAG: hypothetical protein M1816_007270 [Peltula sp. TS41687]|nr:MAG: hypothetical protein M1816_007270 [Peltula sp. TS41687]